MLFLILLTSLLQQDASLTGPALRGTHECERFIERPVSFTSSANNDVFRVESIGPDCTRLDLLVTITDPNGVRVHWRLLPLEFIDIYSPDRIQTPESIDAWLMRVVGTQLDATSETGQALR
ncbi:MAG: hypothetical protein VX501_02530, partial [Pseudomonadota bacterium]|nr:hypothetical protein [Pseudomonadota bacterium]